MFLFHLIKLFEVMCVIDFLSDNLEFHICNENFFLQYLNFMFVMLGAVSCIIFLVIVLVFSLSRCCRISVFLIIFMFRIIIFLVQRRWWVNGWSLFLCFFIVFIFADSSVSSFESFAKAAISFFSFSWYRMIFREFLALSDDDEIDLTFLNILQVGCLMRCFDL